MIEFLKKISGAMIGAPLYPILGILAVAAFLSSLSLVFVLAILIIPIFTAIALGIDDNSSKLKAILLTLASIPAAIIVSSILTAAVFAAVAVVLPFGLILALYQGIKTGIEHGPVGVFTEVPEVFIYSNPLINIVIKYILWAWNYDPKHMQIDAYLNQTNPKVFANLLTDEELKEAGKIHKLESLTRSYDTLLERLNQLKQSIEKPRDEEDFLVDFVDELMTYMPITKPKLLTQEILIEDQWQVVLGTTFITCEVTCKDWWKRNPVHPVSKRPIVGTHDFDYKGVVYKSCFRFNSFTAPEETSELVRLITLIRNPDLVPEETPAEAPAEASVVASPELLQSDWEKTSKSSNPSQGGLYPAPSNDCNPSNVNNPSNGMSLN